MKKLNNNWCEGTPTEDGVYLTAFDEWDEDSDADEFHFKEGKWYKDGAAWFCYGGVWKKKGELPV